MQAVDVDVDHAVVAVVAGRQHRLRPFLERRPRQQAGRGVVGVQQDEGDAARQQLDDAHLAKVEVRGLQRLEQRQHAEHALRAVHDGARQHLVRHVRQRPGGSRRVGRHRLPVQLRPADQVTVRAREHLRARARLGAGAGPADRDVLLRDQQCAHGAPEVVDAALDESREVVGRVAVGRLVLGRPEQQLQVAVADRQAALQVADAGLGGEFALQALQRRAQQRVEQRERPALAVGVAADEADRTDQLARIVAQQEHVRGLAAVEPLAETVAAGCVGRHLARVRVLHQRDQVRAFDAVALPDTDAHAVVEHDGLGTRQKHADELTVGVQRSRADWMRRVAERQGRLHGTKPIREKIRNEIIGVRPARIRDAPLTSG